MTPKEGGTSSASLQGARGRAGGICPRGHLTLWPRRCPHCLGEGRRKTLARAIRESEAKHRAFLDRHNARQQAARQQARGWMEGLA